MNYLEAWTRTIVEEPELQLPRGATAHGECRLHTGGTLWFAGVTLSLAPAIELRVRDQLEVEVRARLHQWDWYNSIVLGVLDVLLTRPIAPIRRFELVILAVEIDDIETRGKAFRIAARAAAQSVLVEIGLALPS